MSDQVIVLTTVSSEAEGAKLARELVVRRLAACVNVIGPVRSVYRWKGELREESEHMLVVKTLAENLARVEETIARLHSYELPEIIALPIQGGSETYLNWLTAHSSAEPADLP